MEVKDILFFRNNTPKGYKSQLMRTLFLIIFSITILFSAKSQKWGAWGSAGGHIAVQGNYIYNNEMLSDTTIQAQIGINPTLSLEGAFNFNEYFQVGAKFKYGIHQAKIRYNCTDTTFGYNGIRKISLNMYSIDLFGRFYAKRGGYFETGIGYSAITNGIDRQKDDLTHINIKNEVSNFYSLLLGVGMVAVKKDRVSIQCGIQAFYGLTDLISPKGNEVRYPTYRHYQEMNEHRFHSVSFTIGIIYDAGRLNASRQTYRYSFFNRKQ